MKSHTFKIDYRPKTGIHLIISMVVVSMLLLLSSTARAQFTWPVYEPFSEYPELYVTNDGEGNFYTNPYCLGDDASSSNYWDFGNLPNSNWQVTNSAALSWPGLVGDPSPTPAGIQENAEDTSSGDVGATFTQQTGTIYASFLLNYQDNGGATANRCIFNIVTNAVAGNSDTHIFSSVWLAPDYGLVIDKDEDGGGVFANETPALATNVPNLIVLRYKSVAGGNDEMDIWVNPPGLGNDNLIPPPTISSTNGPNITDFNGVMLSERKEPNYQENVFQIDELRLGSDWSSVTPSTTAPGPLFGMTGGGTVCAGSTADISVKSSVTTNVYLLYTNGVYSGLTLTGTGSSLDFGQQSTPAAYTVLASNINTAAVGWMTNGDTIAVIPPPQITSEPVAVVTATNSRAEFVVRVSGSGFSYQWYQSGTPLANTTGISGALTNDLVISNATTANIGNYYCIISNSCSDYSITTTNSLALDAPNNLIWAGDAFSINVWGVGTTLVPEFTSGGNPAYFNEGDNVTFNDSYNGAEYGSIITLSNTLTPASITFNTSQVLAWNGPGTISGTGSLLVNGSGFLELSNNSAGGYVNTYTGGTVISNGTVNMPNSWSGLGNSTNGLVTLAGGTLETDQKSSGTGSTLGLPENLAVTANSTWQVDKTGNQCAGLEGALLGNPGTTLTISNSAVDNHQEEFRFNGVFTNYAAIVTAINPLTTNQQMLIGSFNSSGAQLYNAPISGATVGFVVSAAGAVYLNAANPYTNNTLATAGFLAGSGSIAGPLDVSSNATIGAGPITGIGTISIGGGLIMTNGTKVLIRFNKSLAQSNDLISVSGGTITNLGGGTVSTTVTMTNIGTVPLVVGDTFQIFSQPVQDTQALNVIGGGVTWSNGLAVNGSVQVLSINPVILTNAPKITSFVLQTQAGNAVISGTNGQAGATAFLLTSTNLATPLSQWQTVATDILGLTFTITNPVNVGSPQRFFLLGSTNYNH